MITSLAYLLTIWLTAGADEARDCATHAAPSGVGPCVDRPLERSGGLHIKPVLGPLLAALPVDESDAEALPPRCPPTALVTAVQQARVWISPLQIRALHALHRGSARPLGIPTARALLLPFRLRTPCMISLPQNHLHTFRSGTLLCYATAFIGALRLLDLARTKPTSVNRCVKEIVGEIVIGSVAGPGAMLYTIWGEREDALVHA